MLHSLMSAIQDYLLVIDNNKEQGALESLALVNRTAKKKDDNVICVWLEEIWLPFKFSPPKLAKTNDEVEAYIYWEAKGQLVEDHIDYLPRAMGRNKTTSLYSASMPTAEARNKLKKLQNKLAQASSWLHMYNITMDACCQE